MLIIGKLQNKNRERTLTSSNNAITGTNLVLRPCIVNPDKIHDTNAFQMLDDKQYRTLIPEGGKMQERAL